jgi:hypothetical protein
MLLKLPWVDHGKCKRELDCRCAAGCKEGAFQVLEESGVEPGKARGCPLIDLEKCKRCGD